MWLHGIAGIFQTGDLHLCSCTDPCRSPVFLYSICIRMAMCFGVCLEEVRYSMPLVCFLPFSHEAYPAREVQERINGYSPS